MPCEPVGPGVQLLVRERGTVADHRDRVRPLRRLPLEQLDQGDLGDVAAGVVHLDQQPLPLLRAEHVDVRDAHTRIGGQLLQHPDEPGRDHLGRVAVEQLGRVLQVAPQRPRLVHGQAEEQIDHGGRGDGLLELHLEAGDVEVRLLVALPGEHHLEQRLVRRGAFGVDGLDQHVERHVLVLVGRQRLVPHLREQVGERRVAGEVRPQHLGVDEEPDQIGQRLVGPPGDRAADRQIVPAAELVQQHRQRGLQDHRHARPALVGQLLQPGRHLRRHREGDRVAVRVRRRGPRAVQRQVQRLRHPGQFAPPVLDLCRGETVRVARVAEHLALPQCVLLVLHGQRLPLRRPAVPAGGVGVDQVPHHRRARAAVRGDVVDDHDQDVFPGGGTQQDRPEREFRFQIEPVRDGLLDRAGHVLGRHLHHPQPRCGLRQRQEPRVGLTVVIRRVRGAQDLVPVDQVADRRGEAVLIQGSGQAERRRYVVRRRSPLQLVEKPHAALCE